MWAGARATFGATRGKTCFEVRIDGNADTSHLVNEVTPFSRIDDPVLFSAFDENVFIFKEFPNVLRCGWSVDNASMQLGEEPLSFGYGGTAKAAVNCKFNSYGVTFGVGDVIGCFVVSYSTFIARRNVYLYIHFLPRLYRVQSLHPNPPCLVMFSASFVSRRVMRPSMPSSRRILPNS